MASEHINASLDSARDCVRESLNRQENLLKDIQATYEAAFGKKKADTTVVTTLTMAAESYDQLMQDLGQGITFYADLTGILVKFQNKVIHLPSLHVNLHVNLHILVDVYNE